ncbi:hypothetical protein LMG27177_06306 [Paraburkholderia fynbosensis]|uniref:Uncharacterized protein n=1 Tax=Paraburkholderia fynbosensis TaxID=1200993 RepID=A0A6J5GW50_9BURK|nr:hypothetical protein LMG27177_06306 [Paraburkholderia fynbosensis]
MKRTHCAADRTERFQAPRRWHERAATGPRLSRVTSVRPCAVYFSCLKFVAVGQQAAVPAFAVLSPFLAHYLPAPCDATQLIASVPVFASGLTAAVWNSCAPHFHSAR